MRDALRILLCLAPSAVAAADGNLVGLPLESAIGEFQELGYALFYSTDVVRSSMRVEAEPSTREGIAVLDEILEPHGLMLRRGLNESWLIVRQPRPRQVESPTAPESEPATESLLFDAPPVEQIIVAASRYEIRRSQTAPSRLIQGYDLEYLPNVGDDTLRSVARLPGMASTGWSALSNIRGGEISETLVRLDGVRLYDPFHLKDFNRVFSAIDPRIVESIDVYTGGFPAVFGDRMSGVLDINTIPAPDGMHHELGISFFNSSFLSSGRFAGDKGDWVASIRRSNLDVLYDNFSEQPERPKYSDVYARLGFEVGERLRITGNVLRVEDDISLSDDIDREERATVNQRDTYAWVRLDHEISGMTSGSTLIAHSALASERRGTTEKTGLSNGSLTDTRSFTIDSVQSEWSRVIGARMMLEYGAMLTKSRGNYNYRDQVSYDLLFDGVDGPDTIDRSRSIDLAPDGREIALFSSLRIDWTQNLTTEFGLRHGRSRLGTRSDSTMDPRLGLRYALSDRSAVRVSWGRFHQSQAIHELQVSDGVGRFFAPQRTDQWVVGFDRLLNRGIELRLEAYDKSLEHLRPRFENLLNARVLLPELKPDRISITPDSATARGLEISLYSESGAFGWWSILSLARVRDRIGTDEIPRSWDQTYGLNVGLSWDTSRWNVSTGFIHRSGWPTSLVSLDTSGPIPLARVENRNGERLSAFASLDLKVSRKFSLEQSELSVAFELTNLTNRANPCCTEFEIGDEEEAGELVLDPINYLPTIPSLGFLWKF